MEWIRFQSERFADIVITRKSKRSRRLSARQLKICPADGRHANPILRHIKAFIID